MELLLALAPFVFMAILMWVLTLVKRKRMAKLVAHFGGNITTLGTLVFTNAGHEFALKEIGTQNFNNGQGGSYPVLQVELPKTTPWLILPVAGRRFHFLFKFPSHTLKVDEHFAIVCEDDVRAQRLALLKPEWSKLLTEKHHSFELKKVWLVGRKAYVCEYVGLDKDCYQNPEKIEDVLKVFTQLLA